MLGLDDQPFWRLLAETGHKHLHFCTDCGTWRYPPGPTCPGCLSPSADWAPVGGGGEIIGLILSQWANRHCARVISVVGSAEKAAVARVKGCTHALVSFAGDVAARVRHLTTAEGVPVVFDGVGRDTFDTSLNCLRPRGTMVCYGTASGPVPPFGLFTLNRMGALSITCGTSPARAIWPPS